MQTTVSVAAILLGAVIMLLSVRKSADLLRYAPLVSDARRRGVIVFLKVHQVLMLFFLGGYLVVAVSFVYDLELIGKLFVAAVFLFGAAFVLMGILIQARMLMEIQSTMRGILPICSRCNKIRLSEEDPEDRDSWIDMQSYLTARADVRGFCPDCMDSLYGLPDDRRPSPKNG